MCQRLMHFTRKQFGQFGSRYLSSPFRVGMDKFGVHFIANNDFEIEIAYQSQGPSFAMLKMDLPLKRKSPPEKPNQSVPFLASSIGWMPKQATH